MRKYEIASTKIDLKEYITPKTFRTISRDLLDERLAKTKTEVQVIIDLEDSIIDKLSFQVSSRRQIFGFADIRKTKLEKLRPIKRLSFEKLREKYFMLVVHYEDEKDEAFEIDEDELVNVLEGCLRIPELRIPKDF